MSERFPFWYRLETFPDPALSSSLGGFALWTHGLQELTNKPGFVAAGCKVAPQDAITIGAGVQWGDAYKFADSVGKLLVGGDNGFVGAAGGWVQGGGHSFNTPVYGMGVDNLLEMDIVTADGQLQTISECSNPDLFFAVRGGGGGTWGVATRVTYKAHDSVPIQSALSLSTGLSLTGDGELTPNLSAPSLLLRSLTFPHFSRFFQPFNRYSVNSRRLHQVFQT